MNTCELCGEPMGPGEQMFKFHGYSGPCPKPPLKKEVKEKPEAILFAALGRILTNPTGDSFGTTQCKNNWTDWAKDTAEEALRAYDKARKS